MTADDSPKADDFLRELLRAHDMLDLARIAVRQLHALGCHRVQVAWNTEHDHEGNARTFPHGVIHPVVAALLASARRQGEAGRRIATDEHDDCACLLSDDGRQWAALVYGCTEATRAAPEWPQRWQQAIDLLAARRDELLETERLRGQIERLQRAERLQRSLFAISDCASSDRPTAEVLLELHQIVGRLMYARNFFIVRYQREPETMQFVYFADSLDRNRRDPDTIIPAATLGNSLTLAMLRQGLPLHGSGNALREQLKLPRDERIGPRSEDWLGGPMIDHGQVRGAVVVQSYEPAIRYSYDDQTIYWPTAQPFKWEKEAWGTSASGYWYTAARYAASEHGGTHVDAPIHFGEGKVALDELPLQRLIGPAVKIDVRKACEQDRDYRLTVADITAWEKDHGAIPANAIVLVHTGWGQFWPDKKRYLGTDAKGDTANLHFPGISKEAAEFLARERKPSGVGIDTASMDYGQSKDFIAHQVLNGANIYGLENVAFLERVPPTGATLLALPMKIKGGSGGPLRIVAEVP